MTRIALVDDDRDLREVLGMALEGKGHEVQSICNGLKLMGALKIWKPDVLVVDVTMSWIDGITLTKSLKENELYRSVPVIVMSGHRILDIAERALNAGAFAFVAKPFSVEILEMRIRECVGEEAIRVSEKQLEETRRAAAERRRV